MYSLVPSSFGHFLCSSHWRRRGRHLQWLLWGTLRPSSDLKDWLLFSTPFLLCFSSQSGFYLTFTPMNPSGTIWGSMSSPVDRTACSSSYPRSNHHVLCLLQRLLPVPETPHLGLWFLSVSSSCLLPSAHSILILASVVRSTPGRLTSLS